ncbi:MAG: formylglycine-generating enzyme family protein, partial [Treponema sp.]|nr:formylglycine-generating enzyme family protein [Treponema sp.]
EYNGYYTPEPEEKAVVAIKLQSTTHPSMEQLSVLDELLTQATNFTLVVEQGTEIHRKEFTDREIEIELSLGRHHFTLTAFDEIGVIGRGRAAVYLEKGINTVPITLVLHTIRSLIPMARIPAGNFTMGSPETEIGRVAARERQRIVMLEGFYMGITPVTMAQWEIVIGTPPPAGARPNDPVSTNWFNAIVFCNLLSIKEGLSPAYSIGGSTNPADWGPVPSFSTSLAIRRRWDAVEIVPGSTGYRLPASEQWEYACRAGTTTAFNDGVTDDWRDQEAVGRLGWFSFNSRGIYKEVRLKSPNAWGLYDMHGSILEWCWDWLDNPNPSGSRLRVLRGGGATSLASMGRSAFWNAHDPGHSIVNQSIVGSFDLAGFRVVRPLNF